MQPTLVRALAVAGALVALAAACAAIRPEPPLLGHVHVRADRRSVSVELDRVVNDGAFSLEVCLRNVVIISSDGRQETCSLEHTVPCYIVAPSSTAYDVRFRAPARCPDPAPARGVVLADVQWRSWPSNAIWRTRTVIDSAHAR